VRDDIEQGESNIRSADQIFQFTTHKFEKDL